MGAPAKFLFDDDFSLSPAVKERAAAAIELAQRIGDAEARGYRDGFDAAQAEAKVVSDRRTALAMEEISLSLRNVAGSFATVESRMETEAVEVALAVARKLCASLIAAQPITEIMMLVEDCFRHLVTTPHLVVRINDALYDEARERIERLARQCGYEGRLVILAQPDLAGGDCRIEWADGGVTLDRAAIDTKIDELVTRYLAPRQETGSC